MTIFTSTSSKSSPSLFLILQYLFLHPPWRRVPNFLSVARRNEKRVASRIMLNSFSSLFYFMLTQSFPSQHTVSTSLDLADALSRLGSFRHASRSGKIGGSSSPWKLSSATQAYCDAELLSLAETDAGAIRTGNESTACGHTIQFKAFCTSLDNSDLPFTYHAG